MPTSNRWSRTSLLAAAALTASAVPSAVSAQSESTFACDPGFYQVISGQLAELDPGLNTYVHIGSDHNNYNAMGFRSADGYVYGMRGTSLYRIDARGEMTELAQLDVRSGAYTGDFGDDGLLHISRGGGDWYAVDVDTFVATRIDELSVFKGVADITNVHGTFYGVSSDGILYAYDPVARTITPGGAVQGIGSVRKAFGAAWSTAGGNLYVGRNSGEIYQITGYSTGSPVATQVGSAPPTNSNDGASCHLAPPPPGLDDVDGPEPETEPQTPEAQQATETYLEEFPEIEQTFTPTTFPPTEVPTDPEPVQAEPTEQPVEPTDAGIGQGAACNPGLDEDRAARAALGEDVFVNVTEPTTVYESGFEGTVISDFTLLSGNWYMDGDTFAQLNTCGFDYSSLLHAHYVDNFRWEATFKAITGVNQGGLLFNQSAQDTRSGAMVVDLANGGSILRWGTYDNSGYYQNIGSVPVTAPAVLQNVTIAVEVQESQITIFYNGEQVATAETVNVGGMVGLIASESDVAFDSVKLTALPDLAPGEEVTPADITVTESEPVVEEEVAPVDVTATESESTTTEPTTTESTTTESTTTEPTTTESTTSESTATESTTTETTTSESTATESAPAPAE